MKKFLFLISFLFCLMFSFVFCEVSYAFTLDLSVGALKHDPSGFLSYKGDSISLNNDLKLRQTTKPYARFRFEHPIPIIPNLFFQYVPADFKGSNRISRDIRYGDITFETNVDLFSEIQINHYDIGTFWSLWFIKILTGNVIKPEFGVNIRLIDFKGKLSATEQLTGKQISESVSAKFPVPLAYGGLTVNIPLLPISLKGEWRGLSISKVKYYDVVGELRLKPIKPLYVSVGYHQEKIKVSNVSEVSTDMQIKGPFALVGFEF